MLASLVGLNAQGEISTLMILEASAHPNTSLSPVPMIK